MMRFANYTNTNLNTTKPLYNPALDPKASFLFNPPHCVKQSATGSNSPVIAYIKSDSLIQRDMVAQLKEMFSQQHQMGEFINSKKSSFDISQLVSDTQIGNSKSASFFGKKT